MIVVDASAVVELLGRTSHGERIVQYIEADAVHAPHLIDLEITHALRRQLFAGAMSQERVDQARNHFLALSIVRHRHLPLLARIWELRHNFTAYDACYLALTETLDATLLTRDAALAEAKLRSGRVQLV